MQQASIQQRKFSGFEAVVVAPSFADTPFSVIGSWGPVTTTASILPGHTTLKKLVLRRANKIVEKLKWGILGAGNIARTFAKAVQASQTGALTAVGSRAQESADRFGNEFGIKRRHATYAALVADPEVEAIYISLPNHLHAEWTIQCAEAGKHILCEKPLTTNYAEAMTVIEAVRRCDVFMMEAFMYRCHPQTTKLKQLLDEKAIGDVRLIQSNFCYNMGPKYENIRLSNPAAGGGIMDVGCYAASMARLVAGGEPEELKGVAHIGPVSRVDEQSTASLKFPGGIVANLACGTQVGADSELRIWGSEGSIRVPNPWFPGETGNKIILHRNGEDPTEIMVDGGAGLYSIEADIVATYLKDRQAPAPCMTWADSLGNMATLDKWRRSVGLTFDVEKADALAGPSPARLPNSPMQFASVPGVDKPVSRLVMGTMIYGPQDMPFCCSMLDYYTSIGGNCIDTARVYGGGESERAIGHWLHLRKSREQIVLIAKGAHPDWRPKRVNPEGITEDINESLRRLRTDYIDLYLLHRDDPEFPVGEIVECLNEHQKAGRIRAFGGSNWSVARLQEANDYAHAHGLTPFAASSPNFSLAIPNVPRWAGCVSVNTQDLEWYRKQQFPLFSWSSQAGGFFSGRFHRGGPADEEMKRVWFSSQNFDRLERAGELAQKKGCTPIQIAFAYVIAQPFPTFALVGPQTIEETRTSAAGFTVSLTPEEVAWLEGA